MRGWLGIPVFPWLYALRAVSFPAGGPSGPAGRSAGPGPSLRRPAGAHHANPRHYPRPRRPRARVCGATGRAILARPRGRREAPAARGAGVRMREHGDAEAAEEPEDGAFGATLRRPGGPPG